MRISESGPARGVLRVLVLLATLLGLAAPPAAHATTAAAPFKVLALYNGTWDAAHISFVHEANDWFPKQAAANGFTYTASNDWDLLSNGGVNAYQVVLFLDDLPQTVAQRAGFEQYMRGEAAGWASTSPPSPPTRRAGRGITTSSSAAVTSGPTPGGRPRPS